MVYILMGVSGAGKTLIGRKLSSQLEIPFYDGDDFHPAQNVEKMKNGNPLTDKDRRPWLQNLARKIRDWNKEGNAILACSALKKYYRNLLKSKVSEDDVMFIFLKGPRSLIADRIADRAGHFMPEELLKSQFDTLEEPDECITVSVDQPPHAVVSSIINQIKELRG